MTRLSFAVQAHPSRTERAMNLARLIGGEVVWDPEPDAKRAKRSPWRTFRRLMEETPPDATHRVQVQDDATPCPGFREAVYRAAAARPDRMLVFWVGWQQKAYSDAVMAACEADVPWAELRVRNWVPVVATCWPQPLLRDMLANTHDWPGAHGADDENVGVYLKRAGHVPLATVPSLVEHYDDDVPVMGRRSRAGTGTERRAACYVGDCLECLDAIDWTVGPGATDAVRGVG